MSYHKFIYYSLIKHASAYRNLSKLRATINRASFEEARYEHAVYIHLSVIALERCCGCRRKLAFACQGRLGCFNGSLNFRFDAQIFIPKSSQSDYLLPAHLYFIVRCHQKSRGPQALLNHQSQRYGGTVDQENFEKLTLFEWLNALVSLVSSYSYG